MTGTVASKRILSDATPTKTITGGVIDAERAGAGEGADEAHALELRLLRCNRGGCR